MITVLHVITDLKTAGAQTVVMNYLRYLHNDRDVSIKVAVIGKPLGTAFEEEVKREGYEVYFCNYIPFRIIPIINQIANWFKYQFLVYKEIRKISPDIVHTHGTALLPFTLIPVIMSNTRRAVHTLHSDPYTFGKMTVLWAKAAFNIFKIYPICVTEDQAAKAVSRYGIRDYRIIKNGINEHRFENLPLKNDVRRSLGIDENLFVIGCVGRLNPVKNHKFLIDIFYIFLQKKPNSLLLIVGEGEEKQRLKDQIKQYGIEKSVLFLGVRSDVECLYRAMNVFVLASHFESSSIATVEAQFAGTRCVISDSIPQNVVVTPFVNRLSLNAPQSLWLEAIEGVLPCDKQFGVLADFSMQKTARDLKSLYLNL